MVLIEDPHFFRLLVNVCVGSVLGIAAGNLILNAMNQREFNYARWAIMGATTVIVIDFGFYTLNKTPSAVSRIDPELFWNEKMRYSR